MNNEKQKEVQEYYGKTLQVSQDLKTNACCTVDVYPDYVKKTLGKIHDEVLSKYYGCGLCIPTKLEGLRVLDLGSGAGRDCYLLADMVGEKGSVVGIDMTDEQLEVANRHLEFHREAFGYKESNVEFRKGNIEKLGEAGLKDGEFDLIISNCVINLATDKEVVLKDAYRVLKEGGEFYFSDVYCDRRIPQELVNDPVLYGECLSGALYWNDFENLAKKVGFSDPRIVETAPITIENKDVENKTKGYKFYSVTYRLFKLPLEPACEDYGQAVIYKGGVFEEPRAFMLDEHHVFEKGKVEAVCSNSFDMLEKTRYKEHFEFIGNTEVHYGIFKGCGTEFPYEEAKSKTVSSSSESSSCC